MSGYEDYAEMRAALDAVVAARSALAFAEHDLGRSVSVWLDFLDAGNEATDNAFARLREDSARVDAARSAVDAAVEAIPQAGDR